MRVLLARAVSLLYIIAAVDAFSIQKSTKTATFRQRNTDLAAVPPNSQQQGTRRDVLIQANTIALSSLLLGQAWPAMAVEGGEVPQTMIITGANSGIGFEACKLLASQGHNLILACRTMDKARATADRLVGYGGSVIPMECDLASLSSIDKFSGQVAYLFGQSTKIDALCLNAGISLNTAATECARTQDGFELTVGTNHFGHFYLNHRLLPFVEPNGGRIVVTASAVHDPESPGGAQGVPATLGDLKGLETLGKSCEMIDGSAFNADKAYKDSKLCNVLFTRELQRRLEANDATKDILVNCFNPGLIVGTGLFRDQNPFFVKLFDFAATDLFRVGETPEWGGGCLAYMTTVKTKGQYHYAPPGSSKYGDSAYGKQFIVSPVSKEAQDNAKAKLLWELSARELGIAA